MNSNQSKPDHPSFWGQLLMVGIPGPRMDAVARELVRDLKVGGVILFARNIESPEQVWQLCRDLQHEALGSAGRPLLISVDQEGGRVQRLKAPFTIIPPARELGLTRTPEEVENLARQVARELALVGINVNLAPVLDVPRSPACPQWDRAYSSDPHRSARYALAAIRGYLAGGVIPVAKHFPGLGDTIVDSHEVLPRALSSDPQREADLLPFREAVAAGVPLIMTAHLSVPAWDDRPATLSSVALQHWLRRRLGFDGVIITDDLEMGGISTSLPAPQGAREALAAGADLLLICNNWQAAWDAADLLAADASLAPRGREAATRLTRLRQTLPTESAPLTAVQEYFGSPR
ncbi:MAG: beta-N-acetylhexosaminidase [Syntrophobacterales bacterium]|nr:beta-N-acetylhexosaminidase [Syntrophobacterales bacterium]